MKHLLTLLCCITMGGASAVCQTQTDVFKTQTTADIPYRIPAIATTPDGTLVAVADYRFCRSDIGAGRIDFHFRRSADNGRTWGNIYIPTSMQGDGNLTPGHQEAGYGDAALVADRGSKRMLLLCCSGGPLFGYSTVEHHQGMARFRSEDGGLTWSRPEYIGEETVYGPLAQSHYGPIKGWFVGSGRIFQSRSVKVGKYYRLYCAGMSRGDKGNANWVLYSDDFGESWHFLGGCDTPPIPGGDEAKCEELPDGSVLLSSRAWGGRFYNIFTFENAKAAKGRWGEHAFSGKDNGGVAADQNACNGEVMVLPVKRVRDNEKMYLLLQSLPFGPGRANVGIYYKELASPADYATPLAVASEWTGRYQVSTMGSAYSTFTLQRDKALGFFYEEETHCDVSGGGFTMVYKHLTVEEITGGAYRYGK